MKLMPWRKKKSSEPREGAFLSRPGGLEVDRLFDRLLANPWFGGTANNDGCFGVGSWMPPVDIAESETEVVIRSEIPGVDPKGLTITVSGDILTLSGEKSESTEQKGENFFHAERRFGSFHRNVQLPSVVDPDQVKADYENGVLTVVLNRKEGMTAKRIPVSVKK